MPSKKGSSKQTSRDVGGHTSSESSAQESQPPPPTLETESGDSKRESEDDDKHQHKHKHHLEEELAQAIFAELRDIGGVVDGLAAEAKEAKMRKRWESVPVRIGDLMRGFQASVARANRSVAAGDQDTEDIERMSIRDMEVSLSAPIIDSGHAEDPVVMLPNIKSADAESAKVSIKFNVVSVPGKPRR